MVHLYFPVPGAQGLHPPRTLSLYGGQLLLLAGEALQAGDPGVGTDIWDRRGTKLRISREAQLWKGQGAALESILPPHPQLEGTKTVFRCYI